MGVSVLIECWLAGFQDMPCDRKIDQHHGISKQQLRGAPAARLCGDLAERLLDACPRLRRGAQGDLHFPGMLKS